MSAPPRPETGGPPRIALFDYGVGNIHSLRKALEQWGAAVTVTDDWDEALALNGLVLPGVGAFSSAVEALPEDPAPIRKALLAGYPCLGICLGMQILFDASEEGPGTGIGIIPGRVRRVRARIVPQMGWNAVETSPHPLFAELPPPPGGSPHDTGLTAYFANSFVCEPVDPTHAVAWTTHDGDRFASAVARGRTWGTQFHPEKSSDQGRAIVRNFVAMVRQAGSPGHAGAPTGPDAGPGHGPGGQGGTP